MAVFDGLGRRRRVSAAALGAEPGAPGMAQRGGGMPGGMVPPGGGMPGQDYSAALGMTQGAGPAEEYDPIDRIEAMGSESAMEAAALGRRMGAERAMLDAGIEPVRIRKLQQEQRIMNRERLKKATETMMKYKAGKSSVNRRVIAAQNWWKLNNWEEQEKDRGTRGSTEIKSSTGWLWNCIVGKHADAIDSYPEPIILPRAADDQEEAKRLSKIVPVVMEMNGFEEVYNDGSWQKMQEGTGVYGVYWDAQKLNGLGDIAIENLNILNLYWEPGVKDIQDSRNVFFVHYEDIDQMIEEYPELEGDISGTSPLSIEKYKTDDSIDLTGKCVVIDWYYHKKAGGRNVLHFCQYVNESVLYSTEEEAQGAEDYPGFYAHGLYPFVLDPLFPVAGSPAGYGYIDIAKDCQMDIDKLNQAMVQNMAAAATPRFFFRKDGGVNEKEFADWSKPFVHCNGMLGDDTIRPITVTQIDSRALNMLQQKIDEIKFITGNTDVNNGGVPSGVTAASAIAALKEDSGRSSKDSTKAAYRAYSKIVNMVIELIRQYYGIPRQFRIAGPDGNDEFTMYSNAQIQPQVIPNGMGIEDGMRLPVFDIEVRAQRENAYTTMSQNELAIQFYQIGAMAPQNTDQALMLIDMMGDFRGKDELRQKIQQNGTMRDALMQVGQVAMALAQKYKPEVADQLGMTLQGMMADSGMMPAGGGADMKQMEAPADNLSAPNPNENGIVRRAKERAANATRPD